MRPLPQNLAKNFGTTRVAFVALLTAGAWTQGCGGGGAVAPPPPPPPSIAVSVMPPSGSVVLGNQITFTATVTNATDTSVSWSVNGIAGGSSIVGTISPTGGYTAPADLPSPATVQITATSHADSTKSATANITVTSDITLSLTPNPASVELGAIAAISSHYNEQRPSRYHSSLEFVGRDVPRRLRGCGLQRHFHCPGDSAFVYQRHAHCAERRRSVETSLRRRDHH